MIGELSLGALLLLAVLMVLAAGVITVQANPENVKPAADGGFPVVLWERDDAHPDGEAYIAGPGTFQVGETAAVSRAIAAGQLVRVEAPAENSEPGADAGAGDAKTPAGNADGDVKKPPK